MTYVDVSQLKADFPNYVRTMCEMFPNDASERINKYVRRMNKWYNAGLHEVPEQEKPVKPWSDEVLAEEKAHYERMHELQMLEDLYENGW